MTNADPLLGEAESNEIRAALAKAENELQDLLNEFAAVPQEDASTAAALSGQQLAEPMVITLNDGSVLVTSDKNKAVAMGGMENGSNVTMVSEDQALANDPNTGSLANTPEAVMFATEPEPIYSEEEPAPSVFANTDPQQDVWPLILSILAIINIAVILLLFIGRYFWLRHKQRKGNAGLTLSYGKSQP